MPDNYGRMTEHEREENKAFVKFILKWVGIVLLGLLLLVGGCGVIKPQYSRYNAETQKKVKIAEARAESDAAKYQAERAVEIAVANAQVDRERAAGIADANRTIASSLTPEYIQWLYVSQMPELAKGPAATIWVPPNFDILPTVDATTGR